jgi:transglutaminase-like putative cysteine protease
MTRFRLVLSSVLVFALVAAVTAYAGRGSGAEPTETMPVRSFEFTYQVHVPAIADPAGPSHVWIPLPQADAYQDIRGLHIDSPVSYSQGSDAEYANVYAAFTPTAQQSATGFDVSLRFTAIRREHKVALDAATLKNASASASLNPNLQRYLEPDKLVPLNGMIAELAKERTAGDTTPIQKARHIYDYVLATMRYDKSGEGWGRGDAVWACTSKRGNCTDFHSLFIGMMRSSGHSRSI